MIIIIWTLEVRTME